MELMEDIFGEDSRDKLFSSCNGLILSNYGEELFDDGLISIVPDISDLANPKELKSWTKSEPKSYKIKLLDPEHKKVGILISSTNSMC